MTKAAWDRLTQIIVAALAALVPSVFVILNSSITSRKIDEVDRKAHVVQKKIDEVHVNTNSRLTKALERIEELSAMVGEQQQRIDNDVGPFIKKSLEPSSQLMALAERQSRTIEEAQILIKQLQDRVEELERQRR